MKIQLFAGGKRSAVSKEEAEKFLARWMQEIEGTDGVSKIDISCRAWKEEAFDVVQPFFQGAAKEVRYVNFADIIASLLTVEGLSVTEKLAKTFELANLLGIDLSDNAMGPRGLERVESLFANSHVQSLYLSNCGLSFESMELLKKFVLADGNRIANCLSDLVLDKNMMGPDGARVVGEILPHCKNLRYFSYLGCRTQAEGAMFLARGLEALATRVNKPALSKLELDDCTFGADDEEEAAYVPLCAALKRCQYLRHLNLTDGALEMAGLKCLIDSLKESGAQLTHLILDGNGEFGVEGAELLAEFLEPHATSLVCLKCSFNELGDEGVPTLLSPFDTPRNVLQELHLECNEIEGAGAQALVRAQFPLLKKLNVSDNDLPKKHLRAKYGSVAFFGEDDEDGSDDEEVENSDAIDSLISQFKQHSLDA